MRRRVPRGPLVGCLALGLAGLGAIVGSHVRGLGWSDGAGGLWGLRAGSWVSIRFFPGTPVPPSGVHTIDSAGTGGLVIGGAPLVPQRSTSTDVSGLAVAPLVIGGAWFATAYWRARRPRSWQCPTCFYDRRGLPPGTRCPECGLTPPA